MLSRDDLPKVRECFLRFGIIALEEVYYLLSKGQVSFFLSYSCVKLLVMPGEYSQLCKSISSALSLDVKLYCSCSRVFMPPERTLPLFEAELIYRNPLMYGLCPAEHERQVQRVQEAFSFL